MTLVTVATFSNYFDAATVKSLLESKGIVCFLRDEHSATINPLLTNSMGGIKLDIAERDYEAAKEVLIEMGYTLSHTDETPPPIIVRKVVTSLEKIAASINSIPHIREIRRFLRRFIIFLLVASGLILLILLFCPMIFWAAFYK